jgi:hypothetical protein
MGQAHERLAETKHAIVNASANRMMHKPSQSQGLVTVLLPPCLR